MPPGVVNVVPTLESGPWFDAAVDHRAVRMVSFTGSTEVGRVLLRRAADRVLKVVMELGGNAPFIVFADADLDAAVEGAMVAKMRHSAETCTAANRFYVEASVSDEFTEKFAAAMGNVKIGNGFDDGVTCGPLINAGALETVDGLVKVAVGAGASVALGGSPAGGPGFFYLPTVLGDVEPDSPITREEIFGPVAPVIPFTDTDTMIDQANDTELGLTGYVYTRDLAKGLACLRAHPGRDDRPQPRRGVRSGGPVRRDEAIRSRPRRRQRGHLRVLRDPVHRHLLVIEPPFCLLAGRLSTAGGWPPHDGHHVRTARPLRR